jgi:hypothetical protein
MAILEDMASIRINDFVRGGDKLPPPPLRLE